MRSSYEGLLEYNNLINGRRTEDFPPSPVTDLFFYVPFAGYFACKKSFYIRRDNIYSYLCLLTLDGEGEINYKEKTYRLSKNTLMLIDLRSLHEYYALDDGWKFQFIHFDGAMSREYVEYVNSNAGPVIQLNNKIAAVIYDSLEILYKETEKNIIDDYAAISSRVYSLLTSIISFISQSDEKDKTSDSIQRAIAFIIENYKLQISTEDISNAAFLSRSYLSDIFSKKYGIPPHEFLTNYRLSKVKDYLLSTDIPVTNIAEQNGFRDIFTLSRVFKKKVGLSPSEYRKRSGK